MRYVALLCLGILAACASAPTGTGSGLSARSSSSPMRYLAWLEGSYSTSYRADRRMVLERLESLKAVSETDTDSYLEYLSLLDAAGRTNEAGSKIKAFLQKNPRETRAAFLLGVFYMRRNRKELAKYFFEKLEKDSRFAWKSMLLNNLGMMALKEGERFRAIDYFEKAAEAEPPIAAPLVNLGALYLESASYADAERAFVRALDRDKGFEDAVLGRGSALEALGQFESARSVYEDFLSQRPNAVSVLYNNGILLGNRLNQPKLAADMLLRYVQAGGNQTAKAQELIQKWR
ncbi:MAG: tetratricopeptide repeat protein [Bdellovibrionales bacterium]|nr:tetratricopeptide repeat protein [Bdellovibrionales bacterium]